MRKRDEDDKYFNVRQFPQEFLLTKQKDKQDKEYKMSATFCCQKKDEELKKQAMFDKNKCCLADAFESERYFDHATMSGRLPG